LHFAVSVSRKRAEKGIRRRVSRFTCALPLAVEETNNKKKKSSRTTKEDTNNRDSSSLSVMGVIKPKSSSRIDLSKRFERRDLVMLRRATLLAKSSQGQVSPFPFAGCVLVSRKNKVLAETFQYACGTEACELQALDLAGFSATDGSTLYLNMEPGYSLGEELVVDRILQARVKRVVVGMESPLVHLRGRAIQALEEAGVKVDVLSSALREALLCEEEGLDSVNLGLDSMESTPKTDMLRTLKGCYELNENLLHYVAKNRPMCVLKYAMTFDGKTASVSGHSAWISGTQSRQRVFEERALCDCVVVGGETARSDNPKLTTRKSEGHVPTRVVISRKMDLPSECNLWNTKDFGPTLVITEQGSKGDFQDELRAKGVEVVEFKSLNLTKVVDHLYDRGFMRVLWECGGQLAAPALAEEVIHKVMAFLAPKIIGGANAPTPVGDALGLRNMTDALDVTDVKYQQVDQDVLAIGYLPPSKSILHVAEEAYARRKPSQEEVRGSNKETQQQQQGEEEDGEEEVKFYKAWNQYGLLSNFSCVPLKIDDRTWRSVEHYYQAMKFSGVSSVEASYIMNDIDAQPSAEEAARLGRKMQQLQPNLVRQDWAHFKIEVMRRALEVKFSVGSPAWHLLQSTCKAEMPCKLIEYSPRDSFWGYGIDGKGENWLGTLLMEIRDATSIDEEEEEELK
jgi:diaminohydroxyphosphoribosylaminopyrimidine deaminase/5-amino-6-(5-phosphoribosylamino)uracil reductase